MPLKNCEELLVDVADFLKGKYIGAKQQKMSASVESRENAARHSLDTFRDDPEFIRLMTPLVDMEQPGNDWARLSALREAWGCIGAGLRGATKQDERVLVGANA